MTGDVLPEDIAQGGNLDRLASILSDCAVDRVLTSDTNKRSG